METGPEIEAVAHWLGNFCFNYPKFHPKKKPLPPGVYEELSSCTLDMGWGKYRRKRWHQVLSKVAICKVDKLLANQNYDAGIMRVLSKVDFGHLQEIDLRSCTLSNVEMLPIGVHLLRLSLMNNNIRSISCFKRFDLGKIEELLLNDNPIKVHSLRKSRLNLKVFWLERNFNTRVVHEDLASSGIFELESSAITDISIEGRTRILQSSLIEAIERRHHKVERLFITEDETLYVPEMIFEGEQLSSDEEHLLPAEEPPVENQGASSSSEWSTEEVQEQLVLREGDKNKEQLEEKPSKKEKKGKWPPQFVEDWDGNLVRYEPEHYRKSRPRSSQGESSDSSQKPAATTTEDI